MTTSTLTETYYEVLWGIEDNERQTYVDTGDGSFLSESAEHRATGAWLNLIRQGVRAEFCINGVHKAGYDFAEEWAGVEAEDAAAEQADAATVEHKTRTFLYGHGTHMNWRKARIVGDPAAWAVCSCAWKKLFDNRDLARRAARHHRENQNTERNAAMPKHGDKGYASVEPYEEVVTYDANRAAQDLPPWRNADGGRFYTDSEVAPLPARKTLRKTA